MNQSNFWSAKHHQQKTPEEKPKTGTKLTMGQKQTSPPSAHSKDGLRPEQRKQNQYFQKTKTKPNLMLLMHLGVGVQATTGNLRVNGKECQG